LGCVVLENETGSTILAQGRMTMVQATLHADLDAPLWPGWNKLPGIRVTDRHVEIRTEEYFYRYESPSWLICDWVRLFSRDGGVADVEVVRSRTTRC
jgi:hypothetical protein